MIKTTRTDFYDLNTDGNMDLDKVNAFLKNLQEDYKKDKKEDKKGKEKDGK